MTASAYFLAIERKAADELPEGEPRIMSAINSPAITTGSETRLVHLPTAPPTTTFIGWGPKLGR